MADSFDQYMASGQASPVANPPQASVAPQQPADFSTYMQQAQPTQVPPQQPSAPPTGGNPVASAVAGASNAGASMLESGVDAALWATDKLGITNPNISAQAKANVNKDLTTNLRSDTPGAPSDVFTQSAQQYPSTNAVAKYGVGAGLALELAPGRIIEGGSAITKTADLAGRAIVQGLEGAGMAGPNDGSQTLGAILSAASAPLGDILAPAINKAATALIATGQKIKAFLSPISEKLAANGHADVSEQALHSEANYTGTIMKQNSDNYQVIKGIPGSINGRGIQSEIAKLYQNNGVQFVKEGQQTMMDASQSTLDPKQLNVLKNLQIDAGNADTMEKALLLRQKIAGNYNLFKGKGVNDQVMNDYSGLKDFTDRLINQKAESVGLSEPLSKANQFNHTYVQPLINSGAIDRAQAVQAKAARDQAVAKLKPGQPVPPIDPSYAQAVKQVLPKNLSPQKLDEIQSRMDSTGAQILQNHFINQTFGDIQENPNNFDKNGALIKLNQTIAKYGSVLSKPSNDTLQGMKTVLQEAGAQARKSPDSNTWLAHHAGYVIGGIAGGAAGGMTGYDQGHSAASTAIGSLAGIMAGSATIKSGGTLIKGLAETARGQQILQHIANNPDEAKKLVGVLGSGIAGHFNNKTDGTEQ